MITKILDIAHITSAVLMIATILLQRRGAGLSMTFGGDGNFYYAKRGFEKALLIATIILAIIFLGSALAKIVIA
ncbi:MAG: preprotein translocase subunit SecG [bacterium]